MKKIMSFLVVFLVSLNIKADVMARGKITMIDTSTSATGTFAIKVEGAGGYVCNGNPHVLSVANFPDEKSFDRAFSVALVAFTAGYTIEVHNNPASASCPYMSSIRIIKNE